MNWAIQANRLTSETVESVEIRINLGRFCIKFKLNQFLISNLFQVHFNATVRSILIKRVNVVNLTGQAHVNRPKSQNSYLVTTLLTLYNIYCIYYIHYLLPIY